MTIPEARRRLATLAATLDPTRAAEVMEIIRDGLFRRRGVLPTPPKCKPMTRHTATQIRALHAKHPDLSELEIAIQLGLNQGRVSEALIGKRT